MPPLATPPLPPPLCSYMGVGVLLIVINAATLAVFAWFIVIELLDSLLFSMGLLDQQGANFDQDQLAGQLRPKLGAVLAPPAAWALIRVHRARRRGQEAVDRTMDSMKRTLQRVHSSLVMRSESGRSRRQLSMSMRERHTGEGGQWGVYKCVGGNCLGSGA